MHSTAVLPPYHSTEAFPTSSLSLEIKLLKLDLASQGIYIPNQSSSESFMGARLGENYTLLDLIGLKNSIVKADHAIISSEIMTGTSPHHIKDLVSSAKLSEPTPTSRIDMTPLYKTGGGSNLGTPRDYNFSNLSFGGKDDLLLRSYNLHSSQDFLGETTAKPFAKTDFDSIAQIVKENLPGNNLRNSAVEIDLNKTSGSSNIAEEVKKMLEKDKSSVSAKQPTELTTNFDSLTIAQIVKENRLSASTGNLKKSSTPGSYLEIQKADPIMGPLNIAEEVKKMLEKDKLAKQSEVQPTKLSTDFASFSVAQIVKENLPPNAGEGSYLEIQKADPIMGPLNIAEEVKKKLEKDKLAKQSEVHLADFDSSANNLLIAQIVKENLKRSLTAGDREIQSTDNSVDLKEKIPSTKSAEDIYDVTKILEKEMSYHHQINLEPLSTNNLVIAQIVKENLKNNAKTEDTIDLKEKILSEKSTEDIWGIKKILEQPTKPHDIVHLDNSLVIAQIVKENLPSIFSENLNNRGESYLDSVALKEKTSSNKSTEAIFDVKKILEEPLHLDTSLMIAQIVKENLPSIPVREILEKEALPNQQQEEIPRDLLIAKIVKENLPSSSGANLGSNNNQTTQEDVSKILQKVPIEIQPTQPKTDSFNPVDIQNILNLDIKDLTKYLNTASTDKNLKLHDLSNKVSSFKMTEKLEVVQCVKSDPGKLTERNLLLNDFVSPTLITESEKQMLPQINNSAGLVESSMESKIQDILNEFNPKNPIIKKEPTQDGLKEEVQIQFETEMGVFQPEPEEDQKQQHHKGEEPVFITEGLFGNLKSTTDVKASISLNFEFEYNLEKQNNLPISSFLSNLQISDEHPSYNELLLLAQTYANARVFRGSEQTLFLALSFAFFEKLIFKDYNLLLRMTLDYPAVESIFSNVNEYPDSNPSYDQFLKRLKAFLRVENEVNDSVSFFESIASSTKDYQNSLLLFKDILFQVFASSEEYFAFISNCMTHQSFKWISSPSFEDHQIFFNLITKILKTSIRLVTFTTLGSLQENIYISPNESFVTIFYDQRSETSYILNKKEEQADQEIQPVSEERRGIMEDNFSDTSPQVEVSELSISDYQAEEIEAEKIVQHRPAQLEALQIPQVREISRVVVEETPTETEFTSVVNNPQIETPEENKSVIEEQLSNHEELIAIETHSYPVIASTEEEGSLQNEEEIYHEKVLQPVHLQIKEIDLLPKTEEEEIKDELVAASSKVRDEINTILRSLSLNNSPVFFKPIESFSKEVDCSPGFCDALRVIFQFILIIDFLDDSKLCQEAFGPNNR